MSHLDAVLNIKRAQFQNKLKALIFNLNQWVTA